MEYMNSLKLINKVPFVLSENITHSNKRSSKKYQQFQHYAQFPPEKIWLFKKNNKNDSQPLLLIIFSIYLKYFRLFSSYFFVAVWRVQNLEKNCLFQFSTFVQTEID